MKSIVSMLLVFAAASLCSAQAQAGYADGMSQYAAYHVMHGGVDPSGMWKINRDSGKSYATVVSEKGDTFGSLAEEVRLDPEEFRSWLTYGRDSRRVLIEAGGGNRLRYVKRMGTDEVLCPGQKFAVPNVIGMAIDVPFDNAAIPLESVSDIVTFVSLSVQGYKAVPIFSRHIPKLNRIQRLLSPGANNTEKYLASAVGQYTANKSLHGIYIQAHGDADGFYFAILGRSQGVRYSTLSNALNYRLGYVSIASCEGGWCSSDGVRQLKKRYSAVNPIEGNYPGSRYEVVDASRPGAIGGRDLVSPNGYFHGRRSTYVPLVDDFMSEDTRHDIFTSPQFQMYGDIYNALDEAGVIDAAEDILGGL